MNVSFRKPIISKIVLLIAAFFLLIVSPTFAQDAVPAEMLQRTLLIRNGTHQGTGFLMDYQGKLYIITANSYSRHCSSSKISALCMTGKSSQSPDGWESIILQKIILSPISLTRISGTSTKMI